MANPGTADIYSVGNPYFGVDDIYGITNPNAPNVSFAPSSNPANPAVNGIASAFGFGAAPNPITKIDLGTDFTTNNTYNRVLVSNGVITTPIVVNRISGSFYAESVTNIDSDMTITAGTTILMGPVAGMRVTTTGSLAISGTASERVTITGGEQVEGYWGFIQYDGSVNNNNVIEYTDISYGGGNSTRPGNLYLRQNGQVSMGNSSSNYSQRWGVNGVNGTTFNDLGGNTYTGNLEGDNSFN